MRIRRNDANDEGRHERTADGDTVAVADADRHVGRGGTRDADHDGIPDAVDRDADGDGVRDTRQGATMAGGRDANRDGIPDAHQGATVAGGSDVNRDGIPDADQDRTRELHRPGDGLDHTDTRHTDQHLAGHGGVTHDGLTSDGTDATALDRRSVVAREKERYGGVKIGSAFFGWLTATGTAVILVALLAAAGTTIGLAADTPIEDAANSVADPETIGVAGVVGLLVILFISYFCGGYVAGRMARFNGIKQGIAVWVWAVVMAIVVAILAAVAGDEFDVLARVNGFPRLPFNEGDVTTAGVVAVVLVIATSLVGAMLGGLSGMRFHRAVDKAGLGR